MFVEHRVECSSTGNCESNCRKNVTKVQVVDEGSGIVKIPVISCAECLGKRNCPTCSYRRCICK